MPWVADHQRRTVLFRYSPANLAFGGGRHDFDRDHRAGPAWPESWYMGLSDEQKMTWYQHWIKEGFTALETQLANSELTGDFCCGNQPGLADICLVPQVFNAKRFKAPMDDYPTINRIVENCEKLEAFAKAHPDNQ